MTVKRGLLPIKKFPGALNVDGTSSVGGLCVEVFLGVFNHVTLDFEETDAELSAIIHSFGDLLCSLPVESKRKLVRRNPETIRSIVKTLNNPAVLASTYDRDEPSHMCDTANPRSRQGYSTLSPRHCGESQGRCNRSQVDSAMENVPRQPFQRERTHLKREEEHCLDALVDGTLNPIDACYDSSSPISTLTSPVSNGLRESDATSIDRQAIYTPHWKVY